MVIYKYNSNYFIMSTVLPFLLGTQEYQMGIVLSMHVIERLDPYYVYASKMYTLPFTPNWIFYLDLQQKVIMGFNTVPVCMDDETSRLVHETIFCDYGNNKRSVHGLHYNLFTKLRAPIDMELALNS